MDPSSASALEPSSTSAYIFFKISSTSTALILINNVCSKILGPCANAHFHLNSNYEPCFLIQDFFLFIAAFLLYCLLSVVFLAPFEPLLFPFPYVLTPSVRLFFYFVLPSESSSLLFFFFPISLLLDTSFALFLSQLPMPLNWLKHELSQS